ncbi:MAG: hypothetical protein RIQ93_147 [Verrucomicrobiota bacterium]|jgi:DNA-binding LacI/PurR family transcriptional regulator
MAAPLTRSKGSTGAGAPAEVDLAERIRHSLKSVPTDRPLPTTREFGLRFGVANTTVFRVLQRLTTDGEIWQHPTSGRYYPATARALLDRPKPVACLIRRLELGSEQYRELLEGISVSCGALHRTMLLWHDELLVNHPDPHEPPVFAPVAQQRAILNNFLERHGAAAGGFVLDHVWTDDALRVNIARLKPAVVLFRSCSIDGIHNVRADFRSGALKALAHLLGRGFEQIIPVEPFAGDPAVTEFNSALVAAAGELGCRNRLSDVEVGRTEKERSLIIERLRRSTRRSALVCPEDNITMLLRAAMTAGGIACPDRVGLLSAMGTDLATKAGISCLRYDFRALGRRAVDALGCATVVRDLIEPQFFSGATT